VIWTLAGEGEVLGKKVVNSLMHHEVNKKTKEVRSMKKILMIVMVLMISVAFVTTVMAAKKKAPKVKAWVGEVVSVDTIGKTVDAKNEGGEITFDVSAAKFAKNAKFAGLGAGNQIAVKYVEKDGNNIAKSVSKAPAKKVAAKTVKKEGKEGAGEYVDDSWITTKVKSLLAEDSFLKSFEISVKTFKGDVQLSGSVDSQKAIDKAVEITRSVKGVKSVKNNLIVK
jgi:osmotically-inducible protein OsmY